MPNLSYQQEHLVAFEGNLPCLKSVCSNFVWQERDSLLAEDQSHEFGKFSSCICFNPANHSILYLTFKLQIYLQEYFRTVTRLVAEDQ